MAALARRLLPDGSAREDHYVHLRGATWADYERLLDIRGDSAVPRITYLEGMLEIMSPSLPHEQLTSFLERETTSQAIRDYRAALVTARGARR